MNDAASTAGALRRPPAAGRTEGTWGLAWRRFRRHRMAMAGLVVVGTFVLLAGLAPWILRDLPTAQNLDQMYAPPTIRHPLGMDELGRDMLTRIAYGGRVSLTIGVLAMAVAVTLGTCIGAVAGYYQGRLDNVLMRFTDLVLVFPDLILLILLAGFFGTSFATIVLVIGAVRWMTVARLVRASVLSLKRVDFVEAARGMGASDLGIIVRHILPNSLGPIVVAATLGTAGAIIAESTLSYLGLGIQPPTATWGNMLQNAQDQFTTAPWTAVFPGLMIFLTVVSINYIGDGLRDAFDPRTTRR